MTLRGDDRAVTVQVGAILLFGFLIVAMSMYQVTVVPSENRAVEFEHNREVETDVLNLQSAVHRAATAGGAHPTVVDLGPTYSRRTFFVNTPPARGRAATVAVGGGGLRVANAAATSPEVADYWNGTERTFATKSVVYRPSYNEYRNAPRTVFENGVVYSRFDHGYDSVLGGQTLVDGRRLSPVLVDGDLSVEGTGARSITPRGVSPTTRSVAVRGDGGNVTLALPTRLSAETWRSLLASEVDGTGDPTNDRYVHAVRNASGETVEIEMEANATYDLRVASVGVGSNVSHPEPYYVTRVTEASSVAEGSTHTVAFEVRDRYDNPVAGAAVNVSLAAAVPSDDRETLSAAGASGDRLDGLTTDEAGRVTVTYAAPADVDDAETATLTARIADPAADAPAAARVATATFDVGRVRGDGYDVEWNLTEIASQEGVTGCSAETSTCTYDRTADSNEKVTLTAESIGASFVDLDFSANDSAVVSSLQPTTGETDTDETATTEAKIETTGSVKVVASAVDDDDALTLRVEGSDGDGGGQTDPGFAYADVDGDTSYDASAGDTQIPDSKLADGQYDAGPDQLVVPASVGGVSADSVDLRAGQGIFLGTDVAATRTDSVGTVTLDGGDGDAVVDGARVEAAGDGAALDVTTGGTVDVRDATLVAHGTVSLTGGEVDASRALLHADKDGTDVALEATEGDVRVTDATLKATRKGQSATSPDNDLSATVPSSAGTVYVDGATFVDDDDSLNVTPDGAESGQPATGTTS